MLGEQRAALDSLSKGGGAAEDRAFYFRLGEDWADDEPPARQGATAGAVEWDGDCREGEEWGFGADRVVSGSFPPQLFR